jgi:nucleoside-diphosphate-sugar epimerase
MQDDGSGISGQRVLITGGAGAIGSKLSKQLASKNQILVIDNYSSGHPSNLEGIPHAQIINGDIRDESLLSNVFAEHRPGLVFHFAALFANQNSVDHPLKDLDVNAKGTLLLLEQARKIKVDRFIYVSSSCVYGAKNEPLKESDVSDRLDTPYAITKLAGEYYCHYFQRSFGLPTVVLRYFNAYGEGEYPGKYRNVIPNFFEKALKKEPLTITGTGEESRDFTYNGDIIQGTIQATLSTDAIKKVFNLGSGKATRILDVAVEINRLCDNSSGIQFADRRPWDHVSHRMADITLARQVFNYQPTISLFEGLKKTYQWFLSLEVSRQ